MIDIPIALRDNAPIEFVPRSATVENVSPAPVHHDDSSDSESESQDDDDIPMTDIVQPTKAYVIGLHVQHLYHLYNQPFVHLLSHFYISMAY